MDYKIIATGSTGNCVLLNNILALDMGIPFKQIETYYRNLKLVFISHRHIDHLNKATVRKLAKERPTLRFLVGSYLVKNLMELEVEPKNIDIIKPKETLDYGLFRVVGVKLYHDMDTPNMGLKVFWKGEKVFFATDTAELTGIQAKNYNLYLVESNYDEEEAMARIARKKGNGEYIYEYRAMAMHLSNEQTSKWLLENMGENSKYVFLHQHTEKECEGD